MKGLETDLDRMIALNKQNDFEWKSRQLQSSGSQSVVLGSMKAEPERAMQKAAPILPSVTVHGRLWCIQKSGSSRAPWQM